MINVNIQNSQQTFKNNSKIIAKLLFTINKELENNSKKIQKDIN